MIEDICNVMQRSDVLRAFFPTARAGEGEEGGLQSGGHQRQSQGRIDEVIRNIFTSNDVRRSQISDFFGRPPSNNSFNLRENPLMSDMDTFPRRMQVEPLHNNHPFLPQPRLPRRNHSFLSSIRSFQNQVDTFMTRTMDEEIGIDLEFDMYGSGEMPSTSYNERIEDNIMPEDSLFNNLFGFHRLKDLYRDGRLLISRFIQRYDTDHTE